MFRASNIILIFVYFLFFILSMISFGFLVRSEFSVTTILTRIRKMLIISYVNLDHIILILILSNYGSMI